MLVAYRKRIEGQMLQVELNVPDENWERAFDYINHYFCAGMPDLPLPARLTGAAQPSGGLRRGKR